MTRPILQMRRIEVAKTAWGCIGGAGSAESLVEHQRQAFAARRLQDELDALSAAPSDGITPGEREALLRLGADVERAWHAEGATIATRKRIVRMLIEEIIVRVEKDGLDLVIRWAGEDHTALRVMSPVLG